MEGSITILISLTNVFVPMHQKPNNRDEVEGRGF
jgi:hypothetical protein